MNSSPPKRTAELVAWLRGMFELITNDITAGKALSKDLKKAMGLMEALRIDTRAEVKSKARAIDCLCASELMKRREKAERAWLQQLENAVASFAESSADVAAGLDREILESFAERAKDLKRPWVHRFLRRARRRLMRILV